MQFQTYEKYKDSGVEWLGGFPDTWEFKRVKDKLKTHTGIRIGPFGSSLKSNFITDNGYKVYGQENVIKTSFSFGRKYIDEEKFRELCQYELFPGDVVITMMGTTGKSAVVPKTIERGIMDSHLIRLRIDKFNPRLLSLLINDSHFVYTQLKLMSKGSIMDGLNSRIINSLIVLTPPPKEQEVILQYLERKTALIDKKIELLKERKAKYIELKQSLINDAVTKGLDKNIEMKESGIEWAGKIPQHWDTKRLKNIFNERVEKNLQPNGEPVTNNILSVMKDVGVINHRDKGLVGNKMSEDITRYKLVHVDDIVVNKMNVLIGSVGISREFGALSVIYIILKTKSSGVAEYYDYLFKIKSFQKSLRGISTGILEIREAVNMILFMGQNFPIPPKKEQVQIVNFLNEKTEKINIIVKTIDTQIQLLGEFRKTLINDVVTGKVKVT